MYGDFSRLTFQPEKMYTAVFKQQGRVELDADTNENTAILLDAICQLAADMIGRHGGPADGFSLSKSGQNLNIAPGVYYVDGLRTNNEVRAGGKPVTYATQPFAFFEDGDNERNISFDKRLLIYLKVWEQARSAVEEPSIREKALGIYAPDTTLRTRLIWQVRFVPVVLANEVNEQDKNNPDILILDLPANGNVTAAAKPKVEAAFYDWVAKRRSTGTLTAQVERPDHTLDNPCVLDPNSLYRGLENHLYRVEVHSPGQLTKDEAGKAVVKGRTFKWSRDNGSVVFPILQAQGSELVIGGLGRDERCSLSVGDWVEVVDDAYLARGKALPLRQVNEVDYQESRVTLDAAPVDEVGSDPSRSPLLRRWDQHPVEEPEEGKLQLDPVDQAAEMEDGWLNLEFGVQVRFDEGSYATGDYWLIPARVFDGSIEWPQEGDQPASLPPFGPKYHFAPLGVNTGANIVSLRRQIAQAPFA